MTKMMSGVVLVAMTLGQIGCAAVPKMTGSLPIGIDRSPGGPRYTQNGHAIDVGDMGNQLEKEPLAKPHVSTSRALSVVAVLLCAAGGAMIGWPLGQKIGGESKPLWALAGVGAGTIALSIPFSIGSAFSMDSAVTAHNQFP
ncbi:MAG: hypothetical protein ACMG6S_06690 [Byssovorax sp.]